MAHGGGAAAVTVCENGAVTKAVAALSSVVATDALGEYSTSNRSTWQRLDGDNRQWCTRWSTTMARPTAAGTSTNGVAFEGATPSPVVL
jgi:hypothetical protein